MANDCCRHFGSACFNIQQQVLDGSPRLYFSKWAEAIPLWDQTAASIMDALVKVCCTFELPEIMHSDQGRAFESLLLHQTLEAFGIKKSRTSLSPSR